MSTSPASSATPGLPVVVQLGFAGSRFLFDVKKHPTVDMVKFHDAVRQHLVARLKAMHTELGLGERRFFCGLSQLAIGADTIFTQALQELSWPQRFFLPQLREDFLAAKGSDGTPDFTDPQRDAARKLFDSPHVIQERIASDSPDRHTRFQDVNMELVRLSDAMVCVVDASAGSKSGGTRELIDDAVRRERTVLEIGVTVGKDNSPLFTDTWHFKEKFILPALPGELSDLHTALTGIPTIDAYCQPLKAFASRASELKQTIFKFAALVIIGTHLLATGCAVIAIKLHGAAALPWVLGGELVLLAVGFATHSYLHKSHAVRTWAMTRLVAEIARSGLALRNVQGYLGHLFTLPLPESLRPLLRTLNVLHLHETRKPRVPAWETNRQSYIDERLDSVERGQIPYYERKLKSAHAWHEVARWAFLVGSVCAFVATLTKLLIVSHYLHVPDGWHDSSEGTLGILAIVLPLLAVAALSLAASFDLEARSHTYQEMRDFLESQKSHLKHATSERAFNRLALETESRLLGETASWYSRRAFTGVT